MVRQIITVDGLAGSGKSTLAKAVADRLGFIHLNTGLLYRAVALAALRRSIDPHDVDALALMLPQRQLALVRDAAGTTRVLLDGEDVTDSVQQPHISEATSVAAQHRVVREYLVEAQRHAFHPHPMVAEGRDMGTVLFADAPLKLFIQADEAVRIQRRLKQLGLDGASTTDNSLLDKVRIEILERDARDAARALSPTVAAADAVVVNNSTEPLAVVVDKLVALARERLPL
jgi:cytidylate kinase